MSSMAVFSHGSSSPPRPLISFNRPRLRRFTSFNVSLGLFSDQIKHTLVPLFFKPSTFRIRSFQGNAAENSGDAGSINDKDEKNSVTDDLIVNQENQTTIITSSFLVKLAIAVGVAAIFTVASVSLRQPVLGSSLGVQILADSSYASVSALSSLDFTFKAFGYRIVLPAHAPGWIYFWLLMAAGCGLFISEEALNIWVGITLARLLSLDGTWHSFAKSFSRNAPYILSTFLWVYWGVCISDMIPFYLGKMFSQTKASEDVCSKLGIGKERASNITRTVQRYGNFIGFVERFSLGVRNPTAFLAGALGVSPECFFAGVCFGGLITLPLQLGIGFLLRERPVFALATVATAVGTWTVFPYLVAASTALFLFLRRRYSI